MIQDVSRALQLCEELRKDLFYAEKKSSPITSYALPSIFTDKQFIEFCNGFIEKFSSFGEQQIERSKEIIEKLSELRDLCKNETIEQQVAKFIEKTLSVQSKGNQKSFI
jgi:hypothetical protein